MKMRVYQTVEEHFDITVPDGLEGEALAKAVADVLDFWSGRPVFDQVVEQYVEALPA